eukprot:jgi/Mesen1/3894/ME000208S02903
MALLKLGFLTSSNWARLVSSTASRSSTESAGPGIVDGSGGVSLIQGASRGLGLEFVKQLLEMRPNGHVVATCRNPGGADSLAELQSLYGEDRLMIVALDVTQEDTISEAAAAVAARHGRLDLVVNTAGLLHKQGVLQPETALNKIDPKALLMLYQVNAMGPILVTKHMVPLLRAGGGKGTGRPTAVIANISARVGSIGDNSLGGWYSYRASKSALNQLTKTAAVELARKKEPIVSILLHPGTVDTDLSKPFQRNVPQGKLFTKQYSVERLLGIIDVVDASHNGKFYAWDGQEIQW